VFVVQASTILLIGLIAYGLSRKLIIVPRRTTKALEQAREQFRAIADYTFSWESWFDAGGRPRWVNPSVERISGYTADECLAMPDYPYGMFHPDDQAQVELVREKVSQAESGEGVEMRLVTKSGEVRWVRLDWQPIYNKTGDYRGTRISLVDITPRKKVEEALRLSEARFAQAEQVARLGHWNWSLSESVLHWSEETYRILGLDSQTYRAIYKAYLKRVLLADSVRLKTVVKQALAGEESYSVKYRIVRNDGEIRHLLEQGRIERDSAGDVIRVFGTLQDITEHETARLALVRINQLYAVLSEVNKAVVRERNQAKLLQQVCRVMVEIGGLQLAWIGAVDMQAANVLPVAFDGSASRYVHGLRILMTDEAQRSGPVTQAVLTGHIQVCQDIAHEDGMRSWHARAVQWGLRAIIVAPLKLHEEVIATLAAYSDETGFFSYDIVQLIEALAADVSFALRAFAEEGRRQRAEAKLVRLNAELEARVKDRTGALEAANLELQTFSYSVSHDLRAPLRSIDGFSRQLVEHHAAQLNPTARDYLERIMRASGRMGQLIDDLLELSQISRQTMRMEEVCLSSLANEVLGTLHQVEPERAMRTEVEPGISAYADARLMRIVLENLLGNAWKFSAGKDEALIRFGCLRNNKRQVLFVRDNGAGFDNRYADKLFGPFQRLHTTQEFEGTGIGLATVQRIIFKHGGRIWAESTKGEGAGFFFTLSSSQTAENHYENTVNSSG
jgi:PAS domain S-box-containing protein